MNSKKSTFIHCTYIKSCLTNCYYLFFCILFRLKILNLSRNMIGNMPNFGKKCPINELYMSRNNLQDTDEKDALEFLSECGQLKRLHLGFNKIEQINER